MLATSYPAGHNFWPGTPTDWWLRCSWAFLAMVGPVVLAWLLAILMARRTLRSRLWFAPLIVTTLLAYSTKTLSLRDGDQPWFIGARLGQQVAPWCAGVGLMSILLAASSGGRAANTQRGFDVVTRTNDVDGQ